jgi:hypothetical protein
MRSNYWFIVWPFLIAFLTGCSQPPAEIPTATVAITPTFTLTPQITVSSTPTITPSRTAQTGKDMATFVKETYPDYSSLTPGEKFIKTWEIKNTGTTIWNTSYALVLVSSPQKETLGSPTEIAFPQDVPPGETVSLTVPLTAPAASGNYAVYWSLKNERGETFGVDGDRVWVLIMVCETGKSCSPLVSASSTSASGVTATLTSFTADSPSSRTQFCLTLPDRNYGPAGGSVFLLLDQQSIMASSGGSLSEGCFEFEFPVTEAQISQAQKVAVSIAQVRILGGRTNPQGACETARLTLMAQHLGMDFQCNFSPAGYYSDLQLPTGMTRSQADNLIVDSIEGAIYGPWQLNIK